MGKVKKLIFTYIFLYSVSLLAACGGGGDSEPDSSSSQSNNNTSSGQTSPGTPSNPSPSQPANWQLPAGHFIPAKMPMHMVYPRPDNETSSYARHRFAYPNIRYEIPVGVQGGAWPFKYELVQAPAGATIGEVHGSVNYGSISWVAPASGSYTFEVKVTDQELNSVSTLWQVSVDATMFVFIQDGYTGNKVGTINAPLEDIADWYKGNQNDATYHDKIVVFRGGKYNLVGDAVNNNNLRLLATTKSASLIAYPDETPIVDCAIAKIMTDNSAYPDLFVAGIRWENGRQDVANAHFFWAVGDMTRATWWRNHFHNLGPGTVGNDNTLAVFVSNTNVLKENILYKENNHTQIHNLGFNGGYFEAYVSNHVLIEQNMASDSDVTSGFYAKGTRAFVSIRANTAISNVQGSQIGVGNGGESRGIPHDHEICWNNIRSPNHNVMMISGSDYYSTSKVSSASNPPGDLTYSNHIYRNTIVGNSAWVRFAGSENYKVDGNVVMVNDFNAARSRWNISIMDSNIMSNLQGDNNANFVDSNGKLQGSYITTHLGTHGHEVAF